MPQRKPRARCLLLFCSFFDIVFSTVLIAGVALHVATCTVEDESVVHSNMTLEQIEFFYNALEDCGFREESNIPSTYEICTALENRVMPWAGLSLSLNFLIAVYIQIMVHDTYFFLDKKYHNRTRQVSLISIPIGTLVSMSFGFIALVEYTSLNMCWLAYSISEQRKTFSSQFAIFGIPPILGIYKPFELCVFYAYACSLFRDEGYD